MVRIVNPPYPCGKTSPISFSSASLPFQWKFSSTPSLPNPVIRQTIIILSHRMRILSLNADASDSSIPPIPPPLTADYFLKPPLPVMPPTISSCASNTCHFLSATYIPPTKYKNCQPMFAYDLFSAASIHYLPPLPPYCHDMSVFC